MRIIIISRRDIYPYVRTTVKKKYVDRYYALYDHSKKHLAADAIEQMQAEGPVQLPAFLSGQPLRLAIVMQVDSGLHKRDQSNQLKAIEDGLQGTVLANDAWVDQTYVERRLGAENICVIMFEPMTDLDELDWITEVKELARQEGVGADG